MARSWQSSTTSILAEPFHYRYAIVRGRGTVKLLQHISQLQHLHCPRKIQNTTTIPPRTAYKRLHTKRFFCQLRFPGVADGAGWDRVLSEREFSSCARDLGTLSDGTGTGTPRDMEDRRTVLDPEGDAEGRVCVKDMETANGIDNNNEGEKALDYTSWAHDGLVQRILELEQKLKRQNMLLYVYFRLLDLILR